MLSCKEISKLISESLDHRLSWWQRVNVWVHLGMCKLCWGFRKDVTLIQNETRNLADKSVDDEVDSNVQLSDESRDRIRRRLESQQ